VERRDRTHSSQWWGEVFEVRDTGADIFCAPPTQSAFQRMYGGQVAAQCMLAAAATVDDEALPHSLHTSFLRGGDNTVGVAYRIDRIRESRSMSTRLVTAEQSGRTLATSVASFHRLSAHAERAFDHEWPLSVADPPHPAPRPETLPSRQESLVRRYGSDFHGEPDDTWPVDLRYIDRTPWSDGISAPRNRMWLRTIDVPDVPGAHPAALAFATDLPMFEPVLFPTGVPWREVMTNDFVLGSSVDHTIWFHRPVRADDWLLLELFAPIAYASRAFIRGELRVPSGQLVASVAQEVVFMNPRSPGTRA
jgi:acyl-CoA thioesterase-2